MHRWHAYWSVCLSVCLIGCEPEAPSRVGKAQHFQWPAAEDDIVATSIAEIGFSQNAAWTLISQSDFETALAAIPVQTGDIPDTADRGHG
ncbi:MAG: hypothetical protein SFW67_25020 [Myxococcaceae bacterium]|nr:hypothetical protein [Myxococcaceae bacterium]